MVRNEFLATQTLSNVCLFSRTKKDYPRLWQFLTMHLESRMLLLDTKIWEINIKITKC